MKLMIVKDRNVLNTKFLAQFVNSLARLGHDVHVVCDTYKKQGSGVTLDDNISFTNLNGKTKNHLKNAYRFLRQNLSLPCFRFSKFIKKEKPDVIICYFPIDLFNVTFLQKHNIPVIMMMHCYPPIIFNRIQKKSWLKRLAYKQQLYAMQSFEKTLKLSPGKQKIITIPNAVVQIPANKQTDLSIEKKKIIYVARIEKEGKRYKFADKNRSKELTMIGTIDCSILESIIKLFV